MVTQVCQTYLQKIVNDSLAFDSKCGSLGLMLVIFFNVVHCLYHDLYDGTSSVINRALMFLWCLFLCLFL
jgi:hypothetical protein